MNFKLLLVFAILCSFSFADPIKERTLDPIALQELTKYFGISSENLIQETQKKWLRRAGSERWEMEQMDSSQSLFVLDWAEKQGLFGEWRPSLAFYDVALICGATTYTMRKRLNYLAELWKEGIRFSKIAWITGERPLDPQADDLIERCPHESAAAKLLWDETVMPQEMRNLPVLFVDVPMYIENGVSKRPTTQDTILAWIQVAPEPCKALFISTQPFAGHQFAVVQALLPKDFLFDIAAPSTNPTLNPLMAAVTLDSIARWLYQERSN